MSGFVELFESILTDYPREYSQDNNKNNPYFIELKKRIIEVFGELLECIWEPAFELDVLLGGQGRMSERASIVLLTHRQTVSKGIYLAYSFDAANDEVVFGFDDADANEPPNELVNRFATKAASLLPDFDLSNEGYPVKKYKRSELSESIIGDDLWRVVQAYVECLTEFGEEIHNYLKQENVESGDN